MMLKQLKQCFGILTPNFACVLHTTSIWSQRQKWST